MRNTIVLGIDSLDPYVLNAHKAVLPNFSSLIEASPTFLSKSVFPVDTIPAWASIYTGLSPANHGLLYVYDIFDSKMGDLQKLSVGPVRGRTFWDYLSAERYRCVIVFPMMMYPAWDINGVMVSMSPIEKQLDWVSAEKTVDACPKRVMAKNDIPDKMRTLWGRWPGMKRLEEWTTLGKIALETEQRIAMSLSQTESWDLFFAYFSVLDIIQHRLWRFFDERDPGYPGITSFKETILHYYRIIDGFVGEFLNSYADASIIVLSDHGHQSRPFRTLNINEFLRRTGCLTTKGNRMRALSRIRNCVLDVTDKLNIEHFLIRLVAVNERLTKSSKSMYSSVGSIDRSKSRAFLSNFAGIKSYPQGGIEINRDLVSEDEYEEVRRALIAALSELRSPDQELLIKCVKAREDFDPGKYCDSIYPDIVFWLAEGRGVGWELHSGLYGKAHDHKVASGGHSNDAVLLLRNIDEDVKGGVLSILNVAPSILDLFGISWQALDLDGVSIFESRY